MKKKYKELECLLWEKGSVCVVLCYNSNLLKAISVNGAIQCNSFFRDRRYRHNYSNLFEAM